MKKYRPFILPVLIVIILTVAGAVLFRYLGSSGQDQRELYNVPVRIGENELLVQIADTAKSREKGLSGRTGLAEGTGMLFVFPQPTQVTFWMKDMNFPLDIIFIRDNRVVSIEKSAPNFPRGTPLEELPRYTSPEPVDMVLEVPAGWSDSNGVSIGSLLNMINK
jgi:uncharacterized protein